MCHPTSHIVNNTKIQVTLDVQLDAFEYILTIRPKSLHASRVSPLMLASKCYHPILRDPITQQYRIFLTAGSEIYWD